MFFVVVCVVCVRTTHERDMMIEHINGRLLIFQSMTEYSCSDPYHTKYDEFVIVVYTNMLYLLIVFDVCLAQDDASEICREEYVDLLLLRVV